LIEAWEAPFVSEFFWRVRRGGDFCGGVKFIGQ